jgi:hypothetical protein
MKQKMTALACQYGIIGIVERELVSYDDVMNHIAMCNSILMEVGIDDDDYRQFIEKEHLLACKVIDAYNDKYQEENKTEEERKADALYSGTPFFTECEEQYLKGQGLYASPFGDSFYVEFGEPDYDFGHPIPGTNPYIQVDANIIRRALDKDLRQEDLKWICKIVDEADASEICRRLQTLQVPEDMQEAYDWYHSNIF